MHVGAGGSKSDRQDDRRDEQPTDGVGEPVEVAEHGVHCGDHSGYQAGELAGRRGGAEPADRSPGCGEQEDDSARADRGRRRMAGGEIPGIAVEPGPAARTRPADRVLSSRTAASTTARLAMASTTGQARQITCAVTRAATSMNAVAIPISPRFPGGPSHAGGCGERCWTALRTTWSRWSSGPPVSTSAERSARQTRHARIHLASRRRARRTCAAGRPCSSGRICAHQGVSS